MHVISIIQSNTNYKSSTKPNSTKHWSSLTEPILIYYKIQQAKHSS